MWYTTSALDQLFGILLKCYSKPTINSNNPGSLQFSCPRSKEQNDSATGSKWSVNAAFVDLLTKSTAQWVPRGDHKQHPPPLYIRGGQKGKNIPDFLGTFRFMTPTPCPGMFAFLSSKKTQTAGSQIVIDGPPCHTLFNMWCMRRG